MGQVIFAAIDIETTGLDVEKHEIIDFAIVPLNDDFKVSALPEFSIRIKADHPENAAARAMQINRLNPAEGVNREAAQEEFHQWLSDNEIEKIYPVAHNLEFDMKFIRRTFPSESKVISHHGRDSMYLARAVNEIRPKVFMGENVKGLLSHENGRTLDIIKNTISELGYTLIEPRVLKAIMYQVPQKRERLILVAIRNDYADKVQFEWPAPYERVMNLRDAFCAGILYDTDVPLSPGQTYPEGKRKVMELVPEGGDWRDLPVEIQKQYMGGSFYLGGGKTGMARRLSMDEPSLTLTCAPAQKQTERCHPTETRPLTVREYARIQTFPDDWQFAGTLSAQYKQIGNAVPINLAWAVGRSIIRMMNQIERIDNGEAIKKADTTKKHTHEVHYYTPEGEVIQLSLFEPNCLYLSKENDNILVATCRQGNKKWITSSLMYNYPIVSNETAAHPELLTVEQLVVMYRKTVVGHYKVVSVNIVGRKQLQDLGYPVESSKHKSDTSYLLYKLEESKENIPDLNIDKFKIITGKGVKNK